MNNKNIGTLIREKRKELGLTQAQLAELTNSDAYYISRLETGKKKPGSKFLVALSNTLNIPIDYFMGIESNIVLQGQVSELEEKLKKLAPKDRELVLNIVYSLIDRLSPNE